MLIPIIVRSKPGIKRDGTQFDSEYYVDGQWVRFQRQLPRKIGGYTTINRFGTEISRALKTFALDEYTHIFSGGAGSVDYLTMDLMGNTTIVLNRTPTSLNVNELNSWQFDIMIDTSGIPPVNLLLAQCATNNRSLTSTQEGQLFYGPIADPSPTGLPLIEFTWALSSQYLSTSGGLMALFPYLVVFGNAGSVAWSAPNRPTRFNAYEFQASTVVTGGYSPAGAHYILATAGTEIVVGDLISFSGNDVDPYYGVSSVAQLSALTVGITPNTSVAYSAGGLVFQYLSYPLAILPASIPIGDTTFVLAGDWTQFLDALPSARLSFDGGLTETVYVSSAYNPNTTITTVTIATPFGAIVPAGAILSRLESLGFILASDVAIGASNFSVIGPPVGAFVAGARVGFASYSTVLYTVTGAVGVLVNAISLVNPLISAVPAGTTVYLQGVDSTVATGAGNARVASQKIVQGIALRSGAGNSPAALLWSTDALLRMTFVGGEQVFQFDTISPTSSILASGSVIEFDGTYYWIGSDRFLMFNGVVRELQNDLNINWFFENLNRAYANRIFAFKVPRYSEIWWCFPLGYATECSHAVIYNIRENTWYDTKLPNGGRSAGEFMATFGKPLMAGIEPIPDPIIPTQIGYRLWQHESGVDEVDIQAVYPVDSYFETAPFSLIGQAQGKLKNIRVAIVEPDFLQKGAMTLQLLGQANSRAGNVASELHQFPEIPIEPYQQVVMVKDERRILRFRFRSNVAGGDYQLGKIIAHIEETDGTYLGAVNATSY